MRHIRVRISEGVRSFLGLANFFRRYVHNHTLASGHRLTKDEVPWGGATPTGRV
jgi:hypothetical protein